MKDVTEQNFGVIIAFLLPGFLFLWGISYSSSEVDLWLQRSTSTNEPSVGGFLYTTLASLAIGLLISAIRWLILDHLHEKTGVKRPIMKFENLKEKDRLSAFQEVVENHYRYYQYYANTLIAIVMTFATHLMIAPKWPSAPIWVIFLFVVLALFCGSRDALRKYYDRASAVLQ